jgi:hypothetical protein
VGDQISWGEVGVTYSTYRGDEKYIWNFIWKCVGMESENSWEDKWILVKNSMRMWAGFSCLSIVNTVIKLWVCKRQEISLYLWFPYRCVISNSGVMHCPTQHVEC